MDSNLTFMNSECEKAVMESVVARGKEWLIKEELKFSYRTSVLPTKNTGIRVEAEFQLEPANKEVSMPEMKDCKGYPGETQT